MRAPVKQVFVFFVAIISAFIVLEIGLRVLGFPFLDFYRADDICGWGLSPGAEGWVRGEGEAYVKINSAGMRDMEHAVAKPPGVYRVAVLGDSFTEALQVPAEQAFWAVAEREWNERCAPDAKKVEALNFGVSGYGPDQELLVLRHRVWQYSPDAVLLALFTGNDIGANVRALGSSVAKPYFNLEQDRLVADMSFFSAPAYQQRKAMEHRWYRRFALLRGLGNLKNTWKRRWLAMQPPKPGIEQGLDAQVYKPPVDLAWEKAWNITEALICQMHAETRARGARFFVAILCPALQAHPSASVQEQAMRALAVQDLSYADRRIEALGRQEEFPVLALSVPMGKIAREQGVFLYGDIRSQYGRGRGHWNAKGHEVAGHAIAEFLCEGLGVRESGVL